MPDAWDPQQYARFREERAQPFHDLLALLQPVGAEHRLGPATTNGTLGRDDAWPLHPLRAIDLGCGDGVPTLDLYAYLLEQAGPADLLGIDNSLKMIEACRDLPGNPAVSTAASPDLGVAAPSAPSLRFGLGDITRFADKALLGELAPYDLIFSNAALHWVPDHPRLLQGLAMALAPGGQLAVQMPSNYGHPAHVLARQLAGEEPYAAALDGYGSGEAAIPVLPPEQYAALLHRYRLAEQHVRLQVYCHPLGDSTDVVEWVRGTLLTGYQQRLSPELWERFLADYRARLAAELGTGRPYLLTYNRILLWARKGA